LNRKLILNPKSLRQLHMNGISTKEEEIDKNMTQVLFAGFFQKISYKSRWIPQYPSSLDRLVH
jgi:hypothetical protein